MIINSVQLTQKHLKSIKCSFKLELTKTNREHTNLNTGEIKRLLLVMADCKASNGQKAKREAVTEDMVSYIPSTVMSVNKG